MTVSKKITAGLVGLVALGGSLGFGAHIADAQQAPDADAQTQMRDGERRGNRAEKRAAKTAVITELLGVDADALSQARQNGTTLAELAEANGVSTADLVDALVADATARIEAKVAEGFDADRAAQMIAGLEDKITDRVNGVRGDGAARGDRGPRRGGASADQATPIAQA